MSDAPDVPDLHPDRLVLADGTVIPLPPEHQDLILALIREERARALIDATTLTTAALRMIARNLRQKGETESPADEPMLVRICLEKQRGAVVTAYQDAAEVVETVIGRMVYDVRHPT